MGYIHDVALTSGRRRISWRAVSGVAVYLRVSIGLTVDIFSTFCGVFMVLCPKLVLSKFLHLWLLVFDCMFVAKMLLV